MGNFRDSKLYSGMMLALMGLIVSWSIWITSSVYGFSKTDAITLQGITNVCTDINSIRQEIKGLRNDVDSLEKALAQNNNNVYLALQHHNEEQSRQTQKYISDNAKAHEMIMRQLIKIKINKESD